MIIANCQTLERICTTAGSDLYRAHRLTDGMPVLFKLATEHADVAQSARFKREYLLLQSLNVAEVAKPLALVDALRKPIDMRAAARRKSPRSPV
jgi:hypothetical protein